LGLPSSLVVLSLELSFSGLLGSLATMRLVLLPSSFNLGSPEKLLFFEARRVEEETVLVGDGGSTPVPRGEESPLDVRGLRGEVVLSFSEERTAFERGLSAVAAPAEGLSGILGLGGVRRLDAL